jgi:hypothetical protein
MRTHTVFAGVLAVGLAAAAQGQSFNIDMDTAVIGASGDGVPTNAFGGAANTPGTWNMLEGAVTTSIPALLGLDGNPTSVSFSRSTAAGGSFANANAQTSGDFALLMNDGQDLSASTGNVVFTFSNLAAGDYEVYTYAWAPDVPQADTTNVTVTGSSSTNPQTVGGALLPAPDTFAVGVSHALHLITVAAGGSIEILADGAPGSFGTVNGIQIRLVGGGGGCPGDTDGDSDVDADDLTNVILQWGTTCPCTADVDDDNDVDSDDLTVVILEWGTACGKP